VIPTVSFVVPCYKLAHLLRECVDSILMQTYEDFEILIMDDCSPDNTPEVAQSFSDPRVRHIRNQPNLGHLRNYNKGIELSRGKYIWLISADDRLRCRQALERYVDCMERHPRVGFVFCAGMELRPEGETPATYSFVSRRDKIFSGHQLLKQLVNGDFILASSGMVRKTCYDALGAFPLDLPYAGDWYMWCLFAIHYDAAYFAEPMINYRIHGGSITQTFADSGARIFVTDSLKVLWRIRGHAARAGNSAIARRCMPSIAWRYARAIASTERENSYAVCAGLMNLAEMEDSLRQFADGPAEAEWIRARAVAYLGDYHYRLQEFERAREFYTLALNGDGWMPKVWLKCLLLRAGSKGKALRDGVFALRRAVSSRI